MSAVTAQAWIDTARIHCARLPIGGAAVNAYDDARIYYSRGEYEQAADKARLSIAFAEAVERIQTSHRIP
jgi:hypothetical protein